jgi:hypothetical protein
MKGEGRVGKFDHDRTVNTRFGYHKATLGVEQRRKSVAGEEKSKASCGLFVHT